MSGHQSEARMVEFVRPICYILVKGVLRSSSKDLITPRSLAFDATATRHELL